MIFPHNYESPLKRCEIRISDKVYDVTHWRAKHPGGAELLDKFHNADATDAFYALHSNDAVAMLKNIKSAPASEKQIPREELAAKFESWRQDLIKDGWFQRRWYADFVLTILPCTAWLVVGTYLAWSYPLIATLMIGIGMQQAGWMAHDYMHGRGTISWWIGNLYGGLVNGFSPSWWGHKHNTHHCFPNRLEHDSDIQNEPILHLWFPEKGKDAWFRKYQHYYYLFVYAFLYVSWRMQSIQFVMGSKNWFERALIVVNYAWLLCLPWKVAVGSILVGGWLVAVVVTANHQPEPILEANDNYNYCVDQFTTTRGVDVKSWFLGYIFGGMQYQLEHHMFPFMPKYYYPSIRPLMKKFAEENKIPFKVSGVMEIMKMNYDTMKRYAQDFDPAASPKKHN